MRIYRLLKLKKQLEQKQIADLALLPLTLARECLYKMQQAGFVHLQEVPRTADHTPSRTFYLWSVRPNDVKKIVTGEFYAMIRKMRYRLQHEESNSQDLERTKQLSDKNLQMVTEKLESAILQLDNSLMVLLDF